MTKTRIPVTSAAPLMRLSTNRKTATYCRPKSGGNWDPIPNAFGLDRTSCEPHKTPFCESCYAEKIERMFPSVGRLMAGNYAAVMEYQNKPAELAEMFTALLDQSAAAQKLAGVPADAVAFRWLWDGDAAHETMFTALARAHAARPEIAGWLYTRAHKWVHRLRLPETGRPPENLAVFASVDRFNVASARRAAARHPWLRLALCGDSWAETAELAGEMGTGRGLRCPELTGRVPLVNSETRQGACAACRYCLPGAAGAAGQAHPVRFNTGKVGAR